LPSVTIPIENLAKDVLKRLVEIKQDDIADLWRFLLSGMLNLPEDC